METKRKSAKVVVSLLALAGLLVFSLFAVGGSLQPGAPPGPTMKTLDEVEPRVPIHGSDLPLVITEPNSYYLAEDIHFTSTLNHAIKVECNDVTIDLAGFSLKGPDSGTWSGIFMSGRANVEIRNGTVRDFYRGIYENSINAKQHRVINVRVLANGSTGIYLNGFGNLVKDCTATENVGYGIYASHGSTVTGNTCYDNDSIGIYTGAGCTVTGNTVYDNDSHGIRTGSGCTVTGNVATGNTDYGIYVFTYCLVDQNTAVANSGTNMVTGVGCQVGLNVAP